jgi:drug/metabolite transporter (DMT)-like permease
MFLLKRFGGAGCVMAGSALTSLSPFFIEFSGISSVANSFYRMGIGGAVLFLIAILQKKRLPRKGVLALCLGAGCLISLDLVLWNQSIIYIGPGLATVLGNLEVVFLVFIGVLFFGEKLKSQFLWMCGLMVVGIYALLSPYLIEFKIENFLGIAVGIGSSLIYSLYLITLKFISSKDSQLNIMPILACVCLLGAAILALYITFSPVETFLIPTKQGLFCVLSNGFTCQVFGWYLISKGLKEVPLSLSGLLMLTQPSLVFIFDCFFLGRNTQTIQILGCAILLFAIYRASQQEKEDLIAT